MLRRCASASQSGQLDYQAAGLYRDRLSPAAQPIGSGLSPSPSLSFGSDLREARLGGGGLTAAQSAGFTAIGYATLGECQSSGWRLAPSLQAQVE
jgi:hypothetical protein